MKKFFIINLFCLLSIANIYAQSQLKGTVLDETQIPIPYADILLKDPPAIGPLTEQHLTNLVNLNS